MNLTIVEQMREAAHAISQYTPEDETGKLLWQASALISELRAALEVAVEVMEFAYMHGEQPKEIAKARAALRKAAEPARASNPTPPSDGDEK